MKFISTKGHYVDRNTIEANFEGNLEKLNKFKSIVDFLTIIDTSEINHTTIATINKGQVHSAIPNSSLPWWFVTYMPDISALIP